MKRLIQLCGVAVALLSTGALAQELTLFETIETDAAPNTGPFQVQERLTSNGQPAFTLRSTSRIGERFHTVLLNRDGSVVALDWMAGQQVQVPGHEAFMVVNIEGRQVSLQHPSGDGCVDAPDQGVSCQGNIALLSLSNSKPLAVNKPASDIFGPNESDPFAAAIQAGQPMVNGATFNAQGQQVVINPFSGEAEVVPQLSPEEQAARAARQADRAQRLRSFEPERINEADVPAGMRLVRTPFGDRLVPTRE